MKNFVELTDPITKRKSSLIRTLQYFLFYSILYALCTIGSSVGANLMASLHVPAMIWLCFSVSMAGYALVFLVAVKQFRDALMRWWICKSVLHVLRKNDGELGEQQVDLKIYTVPTEGTKRLGELTNMWNCAYHNQGK